MCTVYFIFLYPTEVKEHFHVYVVTCTFQLRHEIFVPNLNVRHCAKLRDFFFPQDSKGGSQELRMLQRKNVELSSLVRKLDEKNQQLATRNAELVCLKYLSKICVVMCEEPAINGITAYI